LAAQREFKAPSDVTAWHRQPKHDDSMSHVLSTVGPAATAAAAAAAAAANPNQPAAAVTCTQLLPFWSAGASPNEPSQLIYTTNDSQENHGSLP
jgi:hypothetical protein